MLKHRFIPLAATLLLATACGGGDGPLDPDDGDNSGLGNFTATVTGDLSADAQGPSTFFVADGRTAILMNAQGGTNFTLEADLPGGRPAQGTYQVGDKGLGSIGNQTWSTTGGTSPSPPRPRAGWREPSPSRASPISKVMRSPSPLRSVPPARS